MSASNHTRLGIIGGGQLAKMLAQVASQWGIPVNIMSRGTEEPAVGLANRLVVGNWDDPEDLGKLAALCDVVTLENEFVDADSLRCLETKGHLFYPRAETIAMVQDKLLQKQALVAAGLPVAPFRSVGKVEEIIQAGVEWGWPLVLKKRRNGYDGKGNCMVASHGEAEGAWRILDGAQQPLYVEAFCDYELELAIMITVPVQGDMACYPLVESIQQEGVCHAVRAPAAISAEQAADAVRIARTAVAAVKAVGSFGVEMFLTRSGAVWINELAPRVHNSGHYTIEACACSQFENHLRAVLGLPLGSTAMRCSAAVMVNLLGVGAGSGEINGMAAALAIPGAYVHNYGKRGSHRMRKMGHVTVIGEDLAETEARAWAAADLIHYENVS
ncbi:MAG: 5-(carboxyamino)imidazole ribonucleotide synthase [Candidatus Eutrophobiaceae bacterium]